jgi:hypothetical protein
MSGNAPEWRKMRQNGRKWLAYSIEMHIHVLISTTSIAALGG